MDVLVREFTDFFRVKRQAEIGKTYEVPKCLVRIGKPRELSFEQKYYLENAGYEKEKEK